jgi:hypothetical protein
MKFNKMPLDFKSAASLIFKEDEAIPEYLHGIWEDEVHRSLPDLEWINRVANGFIYLTVYADLSEHRVFKKPIDLTLFRFWITHELALQRTEIPSQDLHFTASRNPWRVLDPRSGDRWRRAILVAWSALSGGYLGCEYVPQ